MDKHVTVVDSISDDTLTLALFALEHLLEDGHEMNALQIATIEDAIAELNSKR